MNRAAQRRPARGPTSVMAVLVAVATVCGCAGADAGEPGAIELSVFAAASLRDALAGLEAEYEALTPGVTLTIATDSSATMRTQIEHGAPADVFLSADVTNPEALAAAGIADGVPVVFARNQLALIVPAGNPGAITSAADLAKPGIRIIAAGDAVPITGYAGQLLANLARLPGYPSDFVAACTANTVSREENVRSVVTKVALGEGDAAIVYSTDASASRDVMTIGLPASANVDAPYAGVVVRATASPVESHAFLDWLAGPEGAVQLARFGFLPPT